MISFDQNQNRTIEFAMKGVLILITKGAILIATLTVRRNLDPMHPIFEFVFGESVNTLWFRMIRVIMLWFVAVELTKSTIGGIILTISILLSSIRCLDSLRKPKFKSRWRKILFNTPSFKRRYLFRIVNVFRSVFIVFTSIQNSFLGYHFPMLIFSGTLLGVLCNYGTIRLVNVIRMPLYLIMPSISIAVILIMTLSNSGAVHEKSVLFLKFVESFGSNRYEKKMIKSLRAFGVVAGPFGTIKKITKMVVLHAILNYTTTLLVTYEL